MVPWSTRRSFGPVPNRIQRYDVSIPLFSTHRLNIIVPVDQNRWLLRICSNTTEENRRKVQVRRCTIDNLFAQWDRLCVYSKPSELL